MASKKAKQWGYVIGIGVGIIFVTAFLFSQIILPLLLGGAETLETPEVTGLALTQAKRILQELKLHPVVKDSVFSETMKLDVVMDQSPAPGSRIKEDGTVYLVISKGSKMIKVPDVLGTGYQEAMLTLRNYDLRSTIVDSVYSDRYPRNTVVRSMPSAHTRIEKRSMVRLSLSKGPEPLPDSLDWLDGEGL
ncbi:MAG: PASTA domain-containing protein [Candidatus Cloacimonetes bacterium]|jgi:serine/threonine-protein kinase|nr:PASTA domain-containing protein [Candidatus Cloacimonadota bacterium]MDD2507316.1 PASTA domain-containing protein [Candidatus Cloacimonadota bacterium]MDD4148133.1 PASTA domain-containing protein [Candidatus Cloacimonadota bacterium]MDD4560727.1 PASTA domain-containing protein [Candidatus Cloacimonadota bacterium]